MDKKINFLIVEDNVLFSEELEFQLKRRNDSGKILVYPSSEEALGANFLHVDFLIVDYKLPGMDGIQFLGQPQIKKLKIPKMILSAYDAEEKIFEALKKGAIGYLFKDELEDLNEKIDILLSDGAYMTPTIALRIVTYFQKTNSLEEIIANQLTEREKDILHLFKQGFTPTKISQELGIALHTVRVHIKNIYKKLEVRTQLELINKLG